MVTVYQDPKPSPDVCKTGNILTLTSLGNIFEKCSMIKAKKKKALESENLKLQVENPSTRKHNAVWNDIYAGESYGVKNSGSCNLPHKYNWFNY